MEFKTPWVLLLLPAILIFVAAVKRRQRPAVLRFCSSELLTGLFKTWKVKFCQLPFTLRVLSLLFFCIALAGPRSVLDKTQFTSEGINIVLAIDASGSMAAEDFQMNGKRVNRLAVVKSAVQDFIDARRNDRIGIVAFAGQAYTVSPLTTDYSWLQANLERIELNLMEDGTAIGSAIMSSLERLKKNKAKSKIIILLTDGMNNAGKVDPWVAAQAAKALNIRIYTIGAGTKGFVPYPVQDIWGRKFYQNVKIDMDETVLKNIADLTVGKYFRATDTESLHDIYREIDKLEKTEIEQIGYREYQELFGRFVLAGLGFLLLELILSNTFLLRLP